jgi:uncharacterized membrane protein YuzA (DUF378 family)
MEKKKNEFMRWVVFISFALLLIGGLNWLILGVFDFNIFGTIFGNSTVGRILYILLGLPALILTGVLIHRALKKNQSSTSSTSKPKTASTSSSLSNTASTTSSSAGSSSSSNK